MSLPEDSFTDLLKRDKRYKAEAYTFVLKTLTYAQNVLKLGCVKINEPLPPNVPSVADAAAAGESHNHVSGQELCRATRDYAQRQYGLLAPMVLDSMGIRTTGDIGEIVFNLISIGHMRKTSDDRREDFENVFDLRHAFEATYRMT